MDVSDNASKARTRGFATTAVHAGERPHRRPIVPTATPIFPATSYLYDDIAALDAVLGSEEEGFAYSRYGNPTTQALESAIAALEGTESAVAFASGMAALHAAILLDVKSGSKVVASRNLYGATAQLLTTVFASLGVETVFADLSDIEGLAQTLESVRPRVVLCETISNPLLRVVDLPAIVDMAHAVRAKVICDNTFATPALVQPAAFGVDTVVHSTTKYLGGHGDVTGGAVCTNAERGYELNELTKLVGGVPGPFESWLTLRGVKTLPLRIRQQSENAETVARFLQTHPRVERVYWPGFQPGVPERVFSSPLRGGMVALEIRDAGREEVFRFLERLEVFLPGTTLGDVYSLALYPVISSHRGMDDEDLAAAGISRSLVRLSMGIEDSADLVADLDQALA
ncbi:MAG: PLP-dependent transferase [Thermomicrobiales bacterium]|nr:PLP-dependent transferase [Thermomicrobiales bacterium]